MNLSMPASFQIRSLKRLVLTLCLSMALVEFCRAAGELERVQKLGDLEAKLIIETPTELPSAPDRIDIRLSGENLKLVIDGPSSLEVTVPEQLIQTKGWQSVRIRPAESTLLPDGRLRWQGVFRLDPDRPGQASLQLAGIQARTGDKLRVVQWPAIPVTVTTSIQHVSPNDLLENAPLLPMDGWQQSPFVVPVWMAAILLAAGFVTIGWLRYRARRRLREEEPIPWLKRRLGELRAQNVGTPEENVRLYSDLADLLRQFIERRYALPAPTRTTREFLEEIHKSPTVAVEQRTILEEFLRRCDLVKFARETPTVAECDAGVELVLRFADPDVSKI